MSFERPVVPVPYYDVDIDPALDLDLQPLIDLSRKHDVIAGRNGVFDGLRVPNNFYLPDQDQDMFLALSYAAVKKVFTDDESFSAHRGYLPTMVQVYGDVLLTLDRPEHTRSRKLVGQAFLHRNVQGEWLEKHITPVIQKRVESFAHKGQADLVQAYTMHFPFDIISRIIGIPEERAEEFNALGHAMLFIFQDLQAAVATAQRFDALVRELIEEWRSRPREGLLKQLLDTEVDGERLDDGEICKLVRFLVPAGLDTTFRASSNMYFHLLSHGLMDTVREDPALLASAIDESLRMVPVASANPRIATRDVELEGVHIPAGSGVVAFPLTANRDARVFENPDTFDMRRPKRPIMTFGAGIHSCLGNSLARTEMRLAFEIAAPLLPNLRPDPERWSNVKTRGMSLRTTDSLPVLWDPL